MNTVGCGATPLSGQLFYYSFIIIVTLIFLNLFIAIVLQAFEDTSQDANKLLNPDLLDNFKQCWSKYDPDGSCFMPIDQFPAFMFYLGDPLGWDYIYE